MSFVEILQCDGCGAEYTPGSSTGRRDKIEQLYEEGGVARWVSDIQTLPEADAVQTATSSVQFHFCEECVAADKHREPV